MKINLETGCSFNIFFNFKGVKINYKSLNSDFCHTKTIKRN